MIGITASELDTALLLLTARGDLSIDEVLALVMVLGDKVFFLLDLFSGKTIKFPSSRSLTSSVANASSFVALSLSRESYPVEGLESPVLPAELEEGMVISVDGTYYNCVSNPRVVFGKLYILCSRRD